MSRFSIACAWASSPSALAIIAAALPNRFNPALSIVIVLMNLIKSIAIVIILVGLGIIVAAFIGSMLQLQIAAALVGTGFICLGLMQFKQDNDRKRDEEKFNQIMAKLDEIQQELEKEEEPKNKGVAIADIISSGLKYYSEYMTKPKKEEKSD